MHLSALATKLSAPLYLSMVLGVIYTAFWGIYDDTLI